MNDKNIIKKYEDIALSNKDILKLVDEKSNVVLYPELHKFKHVDEILAPYGATYILFESKPNYGHWTLLFKLNKDTLEFFNPYGTYPDDSLEFISPEFKKKSFQDQPYLSILLYNSPYNLTYNEHQFQEYNKNIKSCGRWCALRLMCRMMPLKEFTEMIKYLSKLYKLDYDELVTLLTMRKDQMQN